MNREMSIEDQYWHEDVEKESAMTEAEKLAVRIEDKEYDLETHFSSDYLAECIREASEIDLQALNEAVKAGEALDCLGVLRDMKASWIKTYAAFLCNER